MLKLIEKISRGNRFLIGTNDWRWGSDGDDRVGRGLGIVDGSHDDLRRVGGLVGCRGSIEKREHDLGENLIAQAFDISAILESGSVDLRMGLQDFSPGGIVCEPLQSSTLLGELLRG